MGVGIPSQGQPVAMDLLRDERLVGAARDLAEQLLVELPPRWAHTQAVAALTSELAPRLEPVAQHLLVTAAWLHDIGYCPQIAHTGFHPVDGALFAEGHGYSGTIVGLVAHHSGAPIEAQVRGMSSVLRGLPVPPQRFLDIVTYADLHCGPTGERVAATDRFAEVLRRYPAQDPVHRAVTQSRPQLLAAVRRVEMRLAGSSNQTPPQQRPRLEGRNAR